MRKSRLLHETSLRSAMVLGLAIAVATPVFAQETQVDQAANTAADAKAGATTAAVPSQEECAKNPSLAGCVTATRVAAVEGSGIIVTGSRIKRPNIDSPAPITSISGAEFFQTGNVNLGDVLNKLPQLHSTFNSSNSTRFIGTQGLNLADLRGLGTNRTLVLINGRRQVTSALLSTGTEVDLNTIPTDLIERVDVETGGTSSVYGSDAIAGVVNFVLKQNYDGFQVRGQGGLSQYKDGGSYYVSALAGKNFSDDRGNVALNVEYAKQDPVLASDRAHYSHRGGFVQVDSDPASAVNGSDGIPDYQYFSDLRSAIYSNGGTVENFNTSVITPYIFTPDGQLIPQTGTRVGLSHNSFQGGNGSSFRDGDQLYLVPSQSRIIANFLGHYEVSDAFVPYIEAKYVHNHVIGGQSGPSFMARGSLGDTDIFSINNPFLTDQARGVIRSIYTDGTLDNGDGINDADEYGFYLNRNNVDLGSRIDDTKRDLYRIVGGVRGDLGSGFSYDFSVNYGHFKEHNVNRGNLNVQRYLLAIDAVRDPTSGNIVCRSTLDPSSATAVPGGESFLADDIAKCVPLNLFGANAMSAAAKAYVTPRTYSVASADQLDITGSISGDSSKWFELPGGPIGFALGGEYRRETQYQAFDQYVQSGVTFLNAIPTFDPPAFEVKEAFGEVEVPILRDRPFFNKLLLNGAFRVSDYKGAAGTVWAYNGGGQWSPIKDITFRGNYSRAVRAPALTEAYGVQTQNFAPNFEDPCAADHIGEGTSTRAANCAAAGIPTSYNYTYDASLEILSGGNPNLKAETSDSYSFGALLQPRFVPGLSLSVDYYNITVNKVISAPEAQDIVNACYDAASLNNQFCGLFQRNPAGTIVGGQDISYSVADGTLQQTLLNYAKLKSSGIDMQLDYNHRFGNGLQMTLRGTVSYNIENNQYLFPDDPSRPDQLLYELSYPKWQGDLNIDLKKGPVTFGYEVRYIGKMVPDVIEDIRSVGGRPPQNADYTNFDFYKAVWYHNIRLSLDATEKFNFYGGIDNVTNKLPPYGLTGVGGGSGIYDNRGRFFYIGATAKF